MTFIKGFKRGPEAPKSIVFKTNKGWIEDFGDRGTSFNIYRGLFSIKPHAFYKSAYTLDRAKALLEDMPENKQPKHLQNDRF